MESIKIDDQHKRILDEIFSDKIFINCKELAKIFGKSRSTIYRWISDGYIEKTLRFRGIAGKKGIVFDRKRTEEAIKSVLSVEWLGE